MIEALHITWHPFAIIMATTFAAWCIDRSFLGNMDFLDFLRSWWKYPVMTFCLYLAIQTFRYYPFEEPDRTMPPGYTLLEQNGEFAVRMPAGTISTVHWSETPSKENAIERAWRLYKLDPDYWNKAKAVTP